MNYVSKSQVSTIQDIIYPRPAIPMTFPHHKQNLKLIKEYEQRNRQIQEEKEAYVPPVPYRLKQFDKIPSRYEDTKEWVKREAELRRPPDTKPFKLNPPSNNYISPYYDPQNILRTKSEPDSLFEKYYAKKLRQIENEKRRKLSQEESLSKVNNSDKENNPENYMSHRNEKNLKPPLPKPEDGGLLLPKINRNYIYQNRKLVIDNKVPRKYKSTEQKSNPIASNKNYGKVPAYIKEYKLEEERRKEMIKQQKEESKWPKGTRLLSEEERVKILNDLIKTKNNLENIYEKMPLTNRSMLVREKREEIENKMKEIEKSIEMFSRKRVFVAKENSY